MSALGGPNKTPYGVRLGFGHSGFAAARRGAQDCPYTFMQDLIAGRHR
jgi:hypothetical protein